MLSSLKSKDVKGLPCNLFIFKNLTIIVDIPKEFNYEDKVKVLNYIFIQVNDNEINGNKVDVQGMSLISQINNISVDDNDFENNFTEIMELKASDIHNQTAYSTLKPDYDELTNSMDGLYTTKELDEIKMFFIDKVAYFKKKILASKTIRNIDRKTSKLLSVLVHQSEKRKAH